MTTRQRYLAALAAPVAWAVLMQVGEMLPYADCVARTRSLLVCAAVGLVIACVSVVQALRLLRIAGGVKPFGPGLVLGVGAIFIFAIAMQTLAAAMVDPCQR